jgi:3',5'-cyclic AMP phosphodiesterase CpdA
MTRFAFLSDLHLSRPDPSDHLLHSDTEATLAAVIDRIAALDPAPDFTVLGGDLANHGSIDSYRLLRAMLVPLKMPVIPALGNHDDRAAFRAVFGWPDPADAPLFHHARRAGLHVIALDSSAPGHVSGALDDGQLAALAAALRSEPDLPKLLICHHPPHADRPHALPWESLNADDSARLAATIAGHPVAAMLCGHVHMNRLRMWQGVPVLTTIGLHATVDALEPRDMVIEEGSGFALCSHDENGFEATFVPHGPPRRVLARIDGTVLETFR